MTKITFTNKCAVPSWMPDNKKTFRKNANEYFKNALEQVPFLKDKELTVTYFLEGVGSIVAKIVSNVGDVYVMKTTETVNTANGEICTYKALTDKGIKVPKIFFDGIQDGFPFFIMEYIENVTLADMVKKNEMKLKDAGEILANFFNDIRIVEGQGYGWPVRYEDAILKGNFENINEFVDTWYCKSELVEIANTHMPVLSWSEELKHHCNKVKDQNINNLSRLGSFDLHIGHIFSTTPPTMFDPCARLEPEYFNLGQIMIPFPHHNKEDFAQGRIIVSKYIECFGPIDFDKLLTAVWLQTYRKATNQLMHADERRTKNGIHALGIISDKGALRQHIEKYLI